MRPTGSKNHTQNQIPNGSSPYKLLCEVCVGRITGEFDYLTGHGITNRCDGCERKYFLAIVKIRTTKTQEVK
jgi:hypothetical protein